MIFRWRRSPVTPSEPGAAQSQPPSDTPDTPGTSQLPESLPRQERTSAAEAGTQATEETPKGDATVVAVAVATAVADETESATSAPSVAAEEADPWTQFAPDSSGPRRIERVVHRLLDVLDRIIHHEWVLAITGSLALAAVMTWPVLRHPLRALPEPTGSGPLALGEPALSTWQIAWAGHALGHDPGSILDTNAFQGGQFGYPVTHGLLGYLPLGMIGSGQTAAIFRYNILFVLAFALAAFGGYALARQLGAYKVAAAVAGVAFAYAPWRLGQAGHLEVLSTGGIALSLAMLARGHGLSLRTRRGGGRPLRPGWAIAGWLLAAWQFSLSFATAIPFGYVLLAGVIVAGLAWLLPRPGRYSHLMLGLDALGIGVVSATAVGLGYLHDAALDKRPELVVSRHMLDLTSPPLRGLFTAPAESLLWGSGHHAPRAALSWPQGMAVLPGYFLCALAVAGLLLSVWTLTQRLLLLAGVVLTAVLAMGTAGPARGWAYLLLYHNLPGFRAISSPSWLILWTTLLLALLAAGAITAIQRRTAAVRVTTSGRRAKVTLRWLFRFAALVPICLVLAEGLPSYQVATVPNTPAAFKAVARHRLPAPVLVLPSNENADPTVLLWSVDGFPRLANGAPGTPDRLVEIRDAAWSFPTPSAISTLRELGVKTVIVPRKAAAEAGYAAALRAEPEDLVGFDGDLGVSVTADWEAIVYTLG